MRLIFLRAIIILVVSTDDVFSRDSIAKPSFIPYCRTRDKCKAACSCHTTLNCTVLELDDSTKKAILQYHNQIRDIQSRGEPVPGGMAVLQYDDELEQVSRCWAARCEEEYSECFITSRFNETSQASVQKTLPPGTEPKVGLFMEMMNYWLGQAKAISAEILSDIPAGVAGEQIHNFAQLLSDRVLSVGCAWSRNDQVVTFVCSYGPRGPIAGEAIFKIGKLCSMCPKNYECDNVRPYDRLCKALPVTTIGPPPSPPPLPATPPATSPPFPPPKPPSTTTVSNTFPPPGLPPAQTTPELIDKPLTPPSPSVMQSAGDSPISHNPKTCSPSTESPIESQAPPQLPPLQDNSRPGSQIPGKTAQHPQVPPRLPQSPGSSFVPIRPPIFRSQNPMSPSIQSGPPPMLPQAIDYPPLIPETPTMESSTPSPLPGFPDQVIPNYQGLPPPVPPRINQINLHGTYSAFSQPPLLPLRPSEPSYLPPQYSPSGPMRERLIDGSHNSNYGNQKLSESYALLFPPINLQSQTYVPPRPPLPRLSDHASARSEQQTPPPSSHLLKAPLNIPSEAFDHSMKYRARSELRPLFVPPIPPPRHTSLSEH